MVIQDSPIFLSNKIPILHFKSMTKACCIWFMNSGDSIDDLFDVKGITHMIEHLYVSTSDDIYTNGSTFSSSISFIGISKPTSQLDVYKYMIEWFFDKNNNIKDLITDHNIKDRINELDNETYLKSLQYGDTLSKTESIRSMKYIVYSKFDSHINEDVIKSKLHKLLDYLMQPSNIIIAFYGPNDQRSKYLSYYEKTFGTLTNNKNKFPKNTNNIIHSDISYKENDIILINSLTDNSPVTTYILPIHQNSILVKLEDDIRKHLTTKNGYPNYSQILFSYNGKFNYFLALRISHNNIIQQMKYEKSFPTLLNNLKSKLDLTITKPKKDNINIMDIVFHPTEYIGVYNNFNTDIPSKYITIFQTNKPQYNSSLDVSIISNSDQLSSIDHKTSNSPFHKNNSNNSYIIPDISNQLYHECSYDFIKEVQYLSPYDLENNIARLYFSSNYENIVMGSVLSSIFPNYVRMIRNELYIDRSNSNIMSLINGSSYLKIYDIPSSYMPSIIINMRTYCLLEPYLDYDTAINILLSGRQLYLQASISPIYYTHQSLTYNNDIFFYETPFNYFIHLVKESTKLSYSNIIRDMYKDAGIIYWGDICNYGNYQAVRGIMM